VSTEQKGLPLSVSFSPDPIIVMNQVGQCITKQRPGSETVDHLGAPWNRNDERGSSVSKPDRRFLLFFSKISSIEIQQRGFYE